LTIMATLSTWSPAKSEKKRATIIKNGAPGGWPTCSLKALEMNSPQSHKLTVGSRVRRYTAAEIRKTIHPRMLLASLNLIITNDFMNFAL